MKTLSQLQLLCLLTTLTLASCERSTHLALEAPTQAPALKLQQVDKLASPKWSITSDDPTRGLCLLARFNQGRRLIIAHTRRPCDEARFERGRVELWGLDEAPQKLATFFTWHTGDDASGYLVVQSKEGGPHELLRLDDGTITTPTSARQAKGLTSALKLIIPPKSKDLWLFETISNPGAADTLSHYFAHHSLAAPISGPIDVKTPALFWVDDGLDQLHTPAPGQLQISRDEAQDGMDCALAIYSSDLRAKCLSSLNPIHDYQISWFDQLRLTQHKTSRAISASAWEASPNPALHPKSCTPSRVRMTKPPLPPRVLYQCEQDALATTLWSPERSATLPRHPWLFIGATSAWQRATRPEATRWQSLLAKTAQGKNIHATLDLEHAKLYELPAKTTHYPPRVTISQDGPISLLEQSPKATLRTLDMLTCQGKLQPWMDDGDWVALGCQPEDAPVSCTSARSTKLNPSTLYHLPTQRRWTLSSPAASTPTKTELIIAQGSHHNAAGQLCPAQSLRAHAL